MEKMTEALLAAPFYAGQLVENGHCVFPERQASFGK
jgi:hypothetical protein